MSSLPASRSTWRAGISLRTGVRLGTLCLLTVLLLLLTACGAADEKGRENGADGAPASATLDAQSTGSPAPVRKTPTVPAVDLALAEEDVDVAPLPLRAGFPFTITAVIWNNGTVPAQDVPVMFHMSPRQERLGYMPFLQVLTVTVPASQSVSLELPVHWNFAGGEHQLWVQVNRLPDAWRSTMPTHREDHIGDNIVLLDLVVDPFDASASELCPGRVDAEVGPTDVLPEPGQQRVLVRVHNRGNRALYNLAVVVTGDDLTGITYTPAIPACGGTTDVYVDVDRPFQEGESLTVQVNPRDWVGGIQEDDFENNRVVVTAGLAPGVEIPPGGAMDDYDFSISTADVEIPELWHVLVTVHNLGTRDADMVPIRIENEAGRRLTDAIPLVRGEGQGVAAIRVGYLWIPGGTLTFTVNPEDARGAYPESNRDNNVATFTLP